MQYPVRATLVPSVVNKIFFAGFFSSSFFCMTVMFLCVLLLLHRNDLKSEIYVSIYNLLPVIPLIILFLFSFLWLEVEEYLPGIVTLVEEVQVIQHGWVIEHVVHDLMPEQPTELPNQLEGELMRGINLPPPGLPLRLLPFLLNLLWTQFGPLNSDFVIKRM